MSILQASDSRKQNIAESSGISPHNIERAVVDHGVKDVSPSRSMVADLAMADLSSPRPAEPFLACQNGNANAAVSVPPVSDSRKPNIPASTGIISPHKSERAVDRGVVTALSASQPVQLSASQKSDTPDEVSVPNKDSSQPKFPESAEIAPGATNQPVVPLVFQKGGTGSTKYAVLVPTSNPILPDSVVFLENKSRTVLDHGVST